MIAFNVSDSTCAGQGGVNVNYSNYYMLHVWVLDDMKFIPDVFAGQIPCISGPGGSTTIRDDPDHPCHFGRTGATATASTTAPSGAASTGVQFTAATLRGHSLVCPLATAETAS